MTRAIVLTALLAACTSHASSDLTEIAQINDDGDHLGVLVYFSVGDADDEVTLDDGDQVVVTFRGEDRPLPRVRQFYSSEIELSSPVVADEPLTITLRRGGETLASTIMTSPPIELAPAPLFVSRADDLTLSWSPPTADTMVWGLTSFCTRGGGGIAPNLTTITIPAGSFESSISPGDPAVCSTDLTLTHVHEGTPAAGFAGGHVEFVTTATTSFASTP